MENISQQFEVGEEKFEVLKHRESREEKILANFSPEQQEEIKRKQKSLSFLAYFIGKDFEIPVELNDPGKGWHWDFKENKIRFDPLIKFGNCGKIL